MTVPAHSTRETADAPPRSRDPVDAPGYYQHTRPEMAALVPRDARRVLDVGCGAGGFGAGLKASRPEGIEVWGVEPTDAVDIARQRLDHVVHGLFEDGIDLPAGHFDVITFNDSLEHMPDPAPPLAFARRLLKPGGLLVISVPNVRFVDNLKHLVVDADWRYTADGILDRTHLKFFTRKSIERTVTEAGFQVLQSTGINRRDWIGVKLKLMMLLARQRLDDIVYLQIAVVARKTDDAVAA